MIPLRQKVRGLFLGTAIGDALGMPVETLSPEVIAERYPDTKGRIDHYLVPTGHKWYNGQPAGSTTDDTQLTLAVAEGIIAVNGLDLATQVKMHINAFKESTAGWGGTSREAMKLLADGASINKSGLSGEGRGKGNACAMKIAPVAVYVVNYLKQRPQLDSNAHRSFMQNVYNFVMRLSLMTHNTTMAVQSAIAQTVAVSYCLNPFCDYNDGDEFDDNQFIHLLVESAIFAEKLVQTSSHINAPDQETDFACQMQKLYHYANYDVARCREEFGGLSSLITHSLPPTFILFLKDPFSIETLIGIIGAGGDADTTGAMVGALLGALNGPQVFPQHLVDGLQNKDKIIAVADRLCDVLGVEKG